MSYSLDEFYEEGAMSSSLIPQENSETGIGVDYWKYFLTLIRQFQEKSIKQIWEDLQVPAIDPWTRLEMPRKIPTYFEAYVHYDIIYGGYPHHTITPGDLTNERSGARILQLDDLVCELNNLLSSKDEGVRARCIQIIDKIHVLIFGYARQHFS